MKMQEISDKINVHLKRFEDDPEINKKDARGYRPYFRAGCSYGAGAYIGITYISYQGSVNITKSDAAEYLAWLDAGNIGRHFKALSFNTRTGK